jgi:acetyl-CoA synthetase
MANLESTLQEDRLFEPAQDFSSKARLKSRDELEALRQKAEDDHEGFWADLARTEMDWHKPFNNILDDSNAPHYQWFNDGEINVSYNCLDRHLKTKADKTAIIFEGEKGDTQHITYAQLHADVCRFANGLKSLGVVSGDRVVIYMPMVPEAVIAMQACARIGATHSVVFGGFSAESLKDRIENAGAKVVITADGGFRGGKIVELKAATDEALSNGCDTIEKVVVLKRTDHTIHFDSSRDIWWSIPPAPLVNQRAFNIPPAVICSMPS